MTITAFISIVYDVNKFTCGTLMTPEEMQLRNFIRASLADSMHDPFVMIFLRRRLGISKEEMLDFVHSDINLAPEKYKALSDFFLEHVKVCSKH